MKKYITHHPWKIIEDGFHPQWQRISESLFSIGNGMMGQRATFEESYSGDTHQGHYVAGVYYPDKTRVGWWKNGYPRYFAKVLNTPTYTQMAFQVNGLELDLNRWTVESFRRTLDMESGLYERTAVVSDGHGVKLQLDCVRLCHLVHKELGLISYKIQVIEGSGTLALASLLNGDVVNVDANYEEQFWEHHQVEADGQIGQLFARTRKTGFGVQLTSTHEILHNGQLSTSLSWHGREKKLMANWQTEVSGGDTIEIKKYTTVFSTFYHPLEQLQHQGKHMLMTWKELGFDTLIEQHRQAWSAKWADGDVVIEGDVAAQQGIRFNIFQLNQTYTGQDPRLNIGPKGFTGEKYGGSTYWDTEAYCLPFYLATAPQYVSRNLLLYRYKHLPKAIENAGLLGFENGAALYPMVTMNGEECHNEWEITFEEIHRNGAIAYAIDDYIRYTGDREYLLSHGLEVLIAICRFWAQRVHVALPKQRYVMHGVTGPNEYENNVNNNWYTNYIAAWCLRYAIAALQSLQESDYQEIVDRTQLKTTELEAWQHIVEHMYYPSDEHLGIFLQQEGFLDKVIAPASEIPAAQRPIHQYWSWDRILRSCYIKQADVLQGLYFFEDEFDLETIRRNFDYYEPLTVHESSLSPCVHAILAARLGYADKAYELYLRTARLDLDDYNNDTEDGCHITSMAGTWMAVMKGFAGMTYAGGRLSFSPMLPKQWQGYQFRLRYRGRHLSLEIDANMVRVHNEGPQVELGIYGQAHQILPGGVLEVNLAGAGSRDSN